jgi:hypothetical protein
MISIINAEIFPLWVLNDKAHGGFNFQARESVCSAPLLT